MKRVNSYGNGDHYVHIKIAVPKTLTREQKALMQVSSPRPSATTPAFIFLFVFVQAYAELESDTPGQIFGVTFKTDGKSSSWTSSSSSSSTRRSTAENISEEFTQGPKHEEYEPHDKSGSSDATKERRQNQKFYNAIGFCLVFFLISYLLNRSRENEIIERRDRTIAEHAARNEREREFSDA